MHPGIHVKMESRTVVFLLLIQIRISILLDFQKSKTVASAVLDVFMVLIGFKHG